MRSRRPSSQDEAEDQVQDPEVEKLNALQDDFAKQFKVVALQTFAPVAEKLKKMRERRCDTRRGQGRRAMVRRCH